MKDSKYFEEQLIKLNKLMLNPKEAQFNEIKNILKELEENNQILQFKLIEKCEQCLTNRPGLITLDCKHIICSYCLIELLKKPTHNRLKFEILQRLSINCPFVNCGQAIIIKKFLNRVHFLKILDEVRREYEDDTSFYCEVYLEKISNSFKLELPCGGLVNKETIITQLQSNVINPQDLKCQHCNTNYSLAVLKDDLMEEMNEVERKGLEKIIDQYSEVEVLKSIQNSKNQMCFYCPNVKCNQFLSINTHQNHHRTIYCDYCCEAICIDCKVAIPKCDYTDARKDAEQTKTKCKNHNQVDLQQDKNRSKICQNCKIIQCGGCNMMFTEDFYSDHLI
jgi:hypothetical protein